MAGISIRFRALTHKKQLINAETIELELRAFQLSWAAKERDRLREYPPERPNQHYVRTFRLFRSWVIKGPTKTISALITRVEVDENSQGINYAPLVIGDRQLPIHAETGWRIVTEKDADRASYLRGIRAIYKRYGSR